MIKIAITVRNRLSVTKKCIQSLQKHSDLPHQIYIYDNLTNYKLDDHFEYFKDLYKKGAIHQLTFNTVESTHNAFSKASSLNQFGANHEQDPQKSSTDFLLIIDNDVIVSPGWDTILHQAWKHVRKTKLDNIKVIGQLPGGIKNTQTYAGKVAGFDTKLGKLGGSGFWSLRSDFYRDVGFLDLKQLVGRNKQHDQKTWHEMDKKTNGQPYIMGIKTKLATHVGGMAGSVCNVLSHKTNDAKLKQIQFKEADKKIEAMTFEQFYDTIVNDRYLANAW